MSNPLQINTAGILFTDGSYQLKKGISEDFDFGGVTTTTITNPLQYFIMQSINFDFGTISAPLNINVDLAAINTTAELT